MAVLLSFIKTKKMAKTKKKTKSTGTRRRRRVSGVSGVDVQGLLVAGAGAIAVSMIKKQLTKDPAKTTMVNIAPFVGLGLAVALPMLSKSPMVKQLAIGMGAMGVVNALQKLAPNMVGSLDMVPVIAATTNKYRKLPQPSVNGLGYPLPNSSVYKDSMSVVSGLGCMDNPNGSGSLY